MPKKPKVPCGHPGCPELIEPGTKFCEKHRPLHPEVTRPAAKRGYGSRWQKASKAAGRRQVKRSFRATRCVRNAESRDATPKQRLWITLSPTVATRSYSGIGAIGSHSVKRAMTEKPGVRITVRHTLIDFSPRRNPFLPKCT